VSTALHDASSAAANNETIMPMRIRTASPVNSVASCSPVSVGAGGGMNPAIGQKPMKKRAIQAIPLHAHNR